MKYSIVMITVAISLFANICSASAKDIIFAPLPMEQQIKVSHEIRPMLSYLEQQLNSRISINYFKNYSDIIEKIGEGRIDLAFLGPLPYIQLRKKYAHIIPLVRFVNSEGDDSYTCSIITGIESELNSITLLKDKQIALTQPNSTCGYLMTSKMLQQEGLSIEDNHFRYLGNHQEVALAVIRGEFDAGGVKTSIGRKYAHLGLRFLAETEPLPGFLLIANGKTLNTNQIETIRKALLQLKPLSNPIHRQLTSSWGREIRHGVVPITEEDYDIIRQEFNNTSIPAKGNY